MITVEQLRAKAENQYRSVIKSLIRGENPFPLAIRYQRPRSTAPMSDLKNAIAAIRSQSREALTRGGYTIEWRTVDTRRYGLNDIPAELSFASADDFFGYLGCEEKVRRILENAARLTQAHPESREWAAGNLRHMEKPPEFRNYLLRAVAYFRENPFPGVFARELPVEIPTKFIEENGGAIESLLRVVAPDSLSAEGTSVEERLGLKTPASLIEIRLLDREAPGMVPFSHFTASPEELTATTFAGFDRVVIVENRTTFLTLPPLPKTIGLLGQGYALHRLARLPWLREKRLFYWGDLDVEGFEILAGLRSLFLSVDSILMDPETLQQFDGHTIPGSGKATLAEHARPHLTETERALAESLATENRRLEQEKIPHPTACENLTERVTAS